MDFVTSEIHSLHFTEEETKAQRGWAWVKDTCSTLYWQVVLQLKIQVATNSAKAPATNSGTKDPWITT